MLAPYDLVLVVGAPVFRQYAYEPGPFVEAGTRVAVVSQDRGRGAPQPGRAGRARRARRRSAPAGADGAARDGAAARALRRARPAARPRRPASRCAPATSSPRSPSACRANAIVIEESPSSRPELHARLPAREPLGLLSAAMGGLGFALPAAIGLRMALPDRPVVAIVGDGSSLYAIQALWSAAHYRAGALFVILSNGGYAIMDRLAEQHGRRRARGRASRVDIAGLARAFGCPARTVAEHDELLGALDEVLPGLARARRAAAPRGRRRAPTRASRRDESGAHARVPPAARARRAAGARDRRSRPTCSSGSAAPASAPPTCTPSTG